MAISAQGERIMKSGKDRIHGDMPELTSRRFAILRQSVIDGQPVYNEDLVNSINWLPVTFKIDHGDWFQPHATELLNYQKDLDFKDGTFTRTLVCRNQNGKETDGCCPALCQYG
jgi:trehalose/maltose hydrolase-like predicted phosphorylase